VGPTVQDVRGAPVPGLRGVAPRSPKGGAQFQEMLRQLAPKTTTRPTRATPLRNLRPPVRVPGQIAPRSLAPPATTPTRPTRTSSSEPIVPPAKQALAAAIRRAADSAGVEPALSVAVARAESNLDPKAKSSDGLSVGTFQVTHYTAAEMKRKIAAGTVERPPGTDDVALGVGYLRYLHDLFGRNARLARNLETVSIDDASERRLFAVAAYNAGEGRVAQAQAKAAARGQDPAVFANVRAFLPPITQGYVQRVVGYAREEVDPTAA
jgi:soluble lytic murein transglycosylase-like protein